MVSGGPPLGLPFSLPSIHLDDVLVRAKSDIVLLPENPDSGGSGSGGSVTMGSLAQPLTSFTVNAATVNLPAGAISGTGINPNFGNQIIQTSNSLRFTNGSNTTSIKQATSGQASSFSLFLPPDTGTIGQVLATDGNGVLSWSNSSSALLSGLSDVNLGVPVDGYLLGFSVGGGNKWVAKKTSYSETWAPADGTSKSNSNVGVESIDRPTSNSVQLISSNTPLGRRKSCDYLIVTVVIMMVSPRQLPTLLGLRILLFRSLIWLMIVVAAG